jgi:hypothetical protein
VGTVKLTEDQKHSAVWTLLKEHLDLEIEALRKKNDGWLDPTQTMFVRGQIAALKKLHELDAEHPVVEQEFGD